MLISGVAGTFAHKKTNKQFLQQMIEQVCGGGGGGGGCAASMCHYFRISSSELLYFCTGFFQFTDAFFGVDFANICIFFAVYYVYFIKTSNSALGTKVFVWFLYSWAYFLITASIFLGAIFDTGHFIFCSTVPSLSGTL